MKTETANILVIDRDANVRQALCTALESDGYLAVSAADELEAVGELGKRQFLALLLDTNPREHLAAETSRRLLSLQPNLNVIAMTGSAEPTVDHLDAPFPVRLEKPLDIPCLLTLLKNFGYANP